MSSYLYKPRIEQINWREEINLPCGRISNNFYSYAPILFKCGLHIVTYF